MSKETIKRQVEIIKVLLDLEKCKIFSSEHGIGKGMHKK